MGSGTQRKALVETEKLLIDDWQILAAAVLIKTVP